MAKKKSARQKGFLLKRNLKFCVVLKVLSFSTTRNTSKNISNKTKKRKQKGDFDFPLMVMATCKTKKKKPKTRTRKRSVESVGN
jgi:hypothetical protein